jgi:hypothetical protein
VTKSRFRWVIIGILLLTFLGFVAGQRVYAQTTGGSLYFPETGHFVRDEFLEKYNSVPNSRELFGLPITDAFDNELTGMRVQYFQKVRFELHPEAPIDLRVQLSPLGLYLYETSQTLPIPPNSPACQYFPDTGFSVCYSFLDFFRDNGGVGQFGYPISGFEVHESWIVQYFQRARLEWHPERLPGERVILSNLGSQYFEFQNEKPSLLRPNLDNAIPQQPTTGLKTWAFVSKPILSFRGTQTLYVIVQDQNLRPVQNAFVVFEVTYPGGAKDSFQMETTNALGISSYSFPFSIGTPGIVELKVTATYQTMQSQTKTSFQIWW